METSTATLTAPAMAGQTNADKLERVAFILKSVAHPIRLAVVELLDKHDKLSVTELCQLLDQEQSLMSHHLANLKLKGLLSATRKGKNVYYSLKERSVLQIISCLESCQCNFS